MGLVPTRGDLAANPPTRGDLLVNPPGNEGDLLPSPADTHGDFDLAVAPPTLSILPSDGVLDTLLAEDALVAFLTVKQ